MVAEELEVPVDALNWCPVPGELQQGLQAPSPRRREGLVLVLRNFGQ